MMALITSVYGLAVAPARARWAHRVRHQDELEGLLGTGQPMVVLTSCASLECGFSRELFVRWAPNPRNTKPLQPSQPSQRDDLRSPTSLSIVIRFDC